MPWWKFWSDSDPQQPDYYEEGVALAREARYHEALTSFRLALRERPEDAATLEQMAVVYTHMGLPEEAIKLYRQALAARPRSPSAHYGIAFLLLHRGGEREAIEHLRRFLEGGGGGVEEKHVRHARETLDRLTSESMEEDDEHE